MEVIILYYVDIFHHKSTAKKGGHFSSCFATMPIEKFNTTVEPFKTTA